MPKRKLAWGAALLLSCSALGLTPAQKKGVAQEYERAVTQLQDRVTSLKTPVQARQFTVTQLQASPQLRARLALTTPMVWRNWNIGESPDAERSIQELLAQPLTLPAAQRPPAAAPVKDAAKLAQTLVRGVEVKWSKGCRPEIVYLMHANAVCGQLSAESAEDAYRTLLSHYTRPEVADLRYDFGSYALLVDLAARGLLADIVFLGETNEVLVTFAPAPK